MALTTGTVECLSIADDSGFTTIKDAQTQTNETFILWLNPRDITEFSRVLQSMWVSQIRQAIADGLAVTVAHATNSAIVTSVQLGAAD
jgi:hypothetical protein